MLVSPLGFSRTGSQSGPTVVFLHGFLGCKEDWQAVTEPLKEQCDIITIDLPGHGTSKSGPLSLFDFQHCCSAIRDLLDELRVKAYLLVGYSMGGRIALHFALNHQDKLKGLALISANPGLASELARLSRLAQDEQLAEKMSKMTIESFVDRWYQQPLFATLKGHQVFDSVVSRRSHGDPNALARALAGFSVGRQLSMWDRLCDLAMPTLCVAGGLDYKYTDIMKRAADLCPQGKLRIIDGAGHAVHLEKPGVLAEVLRPFILEPR